jgi:hypothetical protein
MSFSLDVHPDHDGDLDYDKRTLKLVANAGSTGGAPLTIEVFNSKGDRQGEVTFFMRNHELAQRIASAINVAQQEPCEELHIDQLVQTMQAVGITTVLVDENTEFPKPPAA